MSAVVRFVSGPFPVQSATTGSATGIALMLLSADDSLTSTKRK